MGEITNGKTACDIRWIQRFSNYKKALEKLSEVVIYITNLQTDDAVLSDIVREALIQCFEYTHELAWNVMKDYAEYQGNSSIGGSRDAAREAFNLHIIEDAEVWMDMIHSRNETSHTYNNEIADVIVNKIINEYYKVFTAFKDTMETKIELCNSD